METVLNKVLKKLNINLLIVIFLLLVSTLLYKEAVLNGKMVWGQDTPKIVYPLTKLLDESFKNHKFTLWTPNIYFGFPIGAEQGQYGLFYPPNIIHMVLPFITSITILSIFHFFLAGIATYAFCRLLKISRTGSVIASLAFMLNGFVIAHQQYLSHIYSYSYLPVEMFFTEFGLQRKKLWPFVLTGSFLGLQFLTGHPNIAVMSTIAVGIYVPIRIITETSRHFKLFYILKIAVSIFIPLLLVSLPYLSQLKTLLPLSIRANGADFQDATNSSISLYDFITLIFPNFFFGSLKSTWAFASSWHFWSYWGQIETTGYVGILTIILFVISFSKKHLKRLLPFFAILLVSVLIGLGKNTPLYSDIFFKIPIFNGLRAPGKFFYLIDFSLAILASISFDTFMFGKNKVKLLVVAFFPIFLLITVFITNLILRFSPDQVYNFVKDNYSKLGYVSGLNNKNTIIDNIGYSLNNQTAFGLILSFLFAIILINLYRTRSNVLKILLIFFVAFDLLCFANNVNVWSNEENFSSLRNQTIQNLKKDTQVQTTLPRVYTFTNFWSDLLPDQLLPLGIPEANGFSSLPLNRFAIWQRKVESDFSFDNPLLFKISGVDNVYANRGGDPQILTIDNPLPRAYLTTNWKTVQNESDAENQSLNRDSNNYTTAIVEDKTDQILGNYSIKINITPLEIDTYKDDYVKIIETSNAPSLLVLNDTYYPDWKVYINSKEDVIYQTNYLFRGVFIKPGKNIVEFKYKPKLLTESLVISVTSLVAIYIYSIFKLLQERRRGTN